MRVRPIETENEPDKAYVRVTVPVTVLEADPLARVTEEVSDCSAVLVGESETEKLLLGEFFVAVSFCVMDSEPERDVSAVSVTVTVCDSTRVVEAVFEASIVTSCVKLADRETSCVVELERVGFFVRL